MNKLYFKLALLCFVMALCSCEEEKKEKVTSIEIDQDAPVYTLLNPKDTKLIFKNTSVETPKRSLWHYEYMYAGSGVAIADFNNDGLADVFMCGNDTSNALFLNKGDFVFDDITKQAGLTSNQWSAGATTVDINNDGYMDIYVCNSGPTLSDDLLSNKLYINNGNLTFTESAASYGIDDASYSSQAAFFDMDKDGDLDLFVLNHSIFNYGKTIQDIEATLDSFSPDVQKKSVNTLYRNDGNGKFSDITGKAGMFKMGFGLGVSITDFDDNGYLDVYVSNDYYVPDFMYMNNGDGTFTDGIASKANHTSFYSMGCDAADFNNDGLIDLVALDMTPSDHYLNKTLMESMNVELFSFLTDVRKYVPQYMFNTLYLNRSQGNFSEIALMSGVSQTGWSWAPLFLDLDNNTQKDLIITNGFKRDTKDNDWIISLNKRYEREGVSEEVYFSHLDSAKSRPLANYIFENQGNLKFTDKSKDWGFTDPSFSHGAAYADLDNDGDLDMVVNNIESLAYVYRNNTSEKKKNHFVQFELSDGVNTSKVLNSKVKVHTGNITQMVEYTFVRGYLSTMQPLAHFGLGENTKIDKVEIEWPDGTMSVLNDVAIDKKHKIDKQKLSKVAINKENSQSYFMDITQQAGIQNFYHKENAFDDFKTEILLPHKQSRLGPSVSVGDVNKDGLQDFYIGGALGQAGRIYLQQPTGINDSAQEVLVADSKFEDTGSLFFDADADGDLDLYVASGGGGDVRDKPNLLQDRLYLNDGKGVFKKSNALPKITSSTKEVSAFDWDGDGDLDLFVGGRTVPGKYPVAPVSYLLENNNGQFKDITEQFAPELRTIGMVTGATWMDMNRDGRQDLVLVGEWMPITVFHNSTEGFSNQTSAYPALAEQTGWWSSINKGDFDNDGDEDFIVGNIGLNNKFHPSKEKPFHVFSNDFDNNGTLDIVLSKLYKGNLAPVRGKECSTQQMPFISEKFPMYSQFASSTLEDIYGAETLANSLHYVATNFASVYVENNGDGTFSVSELPMEAQISPINDMIVLDFNKDGNLDLIAGGNVYETEVETPSYDAGKGLMMLGNGDGTFRTVPKVLDSGVFLPYNLKNMALFTLAGNRPALLAVNNDGPPQLLAWAR